MATNYQGRRVESLQTALQIKNILKDIVFVDGNLEEAMYLALMNELGFMTTPLVEFKWEEDDWLPLTDTTAAAATAAETTIQVTSYLAYIPNFLWKNKRTGELFLVTESNAAGYISVIRAVGRNTTDSTGTAAAAMNSGDTLIRVGSVVGESSSRQIAQSTTPAEVSNYAQKLRYEVEMSDVQRKTRQITGADWGYQLDKAMKQARKDMNGWLYEGQKNTGTVAGQKTWYSGGANFFITTNELVSTGTLHEYQLDEWLTDEGLRYGPSKKRMLASSAVIRAINQIAKDRMTVQYQPMGDAKANIGVQVLRYISPSGKTLDIFEDRYLSVARQGSFYLFDTDVMMLRDFSGDGIDGKPRLIENTQDNDDDGSVATILAHMGPHFGPEKHHGKGSGITAGAAGRSVS